MTTHRVTTWNGLVRVLNNYTPRTIVHLEKGLLPHPRTAGMTSSIGLPEGQVADYRLVLAGGAGLHVKDFGTHYEAHIDEVHPEVNIAEHLRRDAPAMYVAAGAAIGAAVGRSVGASKNGTLVGAAIGGVFAAMIAMADDE
jgi:hypothetical protein